jgi:hypothetical protein
MGDSFGFQGNQPINSALFSTRPKNLIREEMFDWNFQLPHGQQHQFLTIAHLG